MRLFLLSTVQIWGLVLGVVFFAAFLYCGLVWIPKRVSGGRQPFAGRRIKVIDRVMLTREASVLLIQAGTRLLLVGAGRSGLALLAELSPSDFPEFAKKSENTPEQPGFWGRFARNLKSNITGAPPDPAGDISFAELLREMENPVAGHAGDAGYGSILEEVPPKRPSYQSSIENMSRLSEPDALDRRTRHPQSPPKQTVRPPHPKPVPPQPEPQPVPPEEREERIDQLLDLIAQRQSRLDERNNTGDMG